MPAIKCHLGHEQSISTDDWVATLTLDQLRYACTALGDKIKVAEASYQHHTGVGEPV